METNQSHLNLLSEKQAATRIGVARITLLRARQAGHIKFFRIGTRVLYSEAQLIEFLSACECNERQQDDGGSSGLTRLSARRKDNRVSASRRSAAVQKSTRVESGTESAVAGQVAFQFVATR